MQLLSKYLYFDPKMVFGAAPENPLHKLVQKWSFHKNSTPHVCAMAKWFRRNFEDVIHILAALLGSLGFCDGSGCCHLPPLWQISLSKSDGFCLKNCSPHQWNIHLNLGGKWGTIICFLSKDFLHCLLKEYAVVVSVCRHFLKQAQASTSHRPRHSCS